MVLSHTAMPLAGAGQSRIGDCKGCLPNALPFTFTLWTATDRPKRIGVVFGLQGYLTRRTVEPLVRVLFNVTGAKALAN